MNNLTDANLPRRGNYQLSIHKIDHHVIREVAAYESIVVYSVNTILVWMDLEPRNPAVFLVVRN